ncbi:MAG: hypothetical protein IT239_06225 [Bacteroidia bacterium]|nr:hypothetical protein [Bacteroidia bacterium]
MEQKMTSYHKAYIYWFVLLCGLSLISSYIQYTLVNQSSSTLLTLYRLSYIALVISVFGYVVFTHIVIKKTNSNLGFLVGLIALIPYGFLVSLLIARHILSKRGLWGKDETFQKSPEGTHWSKKKLGLGQTILYISIGFFIMIILIAVIASLLAR